MRAAALASAFALGALAAAPAAHAAQAEQITRADGVAGVSPVEGHIVNPSFITEDGATAYFFFSQEWGTWSTATGLWRRDLATNKSTQVTGGAALPTGLSADGRLLGFQSAKRLVAADTNSATDLYSYDSVTKKIDLVSRWDGLTAGASGLTPGSEAFITRDGKFALYSTSVGIARRELATGKTVKVADGRIAGVQKGASADGTVFETSTDTLVTPGGTRDLTLAGAYDADGVVSPNGRYAVVTARRQADGTRVGYLLDTTTNVRTTFNPDALGAAARYVGFTADNRALVARPTTSNAFEVLALTLPAGTSTRVATYPASITRISSIASTGRFAVQSGGAAFALAADGVNLPGGVDLPSAGAFVSVYMGCNAIGWPWYRSAEPASFLADDPTAALPTVTKLSQLEIRVLATTGATVSTYTLVPGQPWPGTTNLLVGGGFKVAVTAKFADGRSSSETTTIPAPNTTC